MTAQLDLGFAGSSRDDQWTYHCGLPDRSGIAQYTHMIQWGWDPPETRARGAEAREDGARDAGWQKRAATVDEARAAIVGLLSKDAIPRTFNCMTIQLYGSRASGFGGSSVEKALWALVAESRLWWACEEGAVFFALAEHIVPDEAEAAE